MSWWEMDALMFPWKCRKILFPCIISILSRQNKYTGRVQVDTAMQNVGSCGNHQYNSANFYCGCPWLQQLSKFHQSYWSLSWVRVRQHASPSLRVRVRIHGVLSPSPSPRSASPSPSPRNLGLSPDSSPDSSESRRVHLYHRIIS